MIKNQQAVFGSASMCEDLTFCKQAKVSLGLVEGGHKTNSRPEQRAFL